MKRRPVPTLLAALLAAAQTFAPPLRAAEPLAICLDENIPLYSLREAGKASGFFVALSQEIAQRLERPLRIQWFETKLDPDASRTLDVNALLSDGRCDLAGGYPLVRDALGKPGMATARMPDFDGAKPADRRRRVELGTLLPTRAYLYAPITIVLAPAVSKPVKAIADLEGMKLGVESSTLSDAILMLYHDGRLVDKVTHLVPGRYELLPLLEQGAFEATLVNLRRFDAYRAAHPETKIKPTGYYYRFGFNMGYVGLSNAAPLVDQVSKVIDDMLGKNDMAPLAQAAGLTYVPPRQPEIHDGFTLRDLRSE
jgi:ABC-type amino acid transport substrate-binding protein